MTELCLSGGIACGGCPAHMGNCQSYNHLQQGSGGEILGLTRVAVDQCLGVNGGGLGASGS